MKSNCCFGWRHACVLAINLWIAFIITAHAQDHPVTFHEVEGPGGKPLRSLRNITQDPNGYMWFSGEEEKCLYRYDGKNMTIYRNDFMDPNSLGGLYIGVVYADNKGIIWIGTGNGMDRFDNE